jgi:hypothetical protein
MAIMRKLATEILRKVGAENEHRRTKNSPKKASVQDFSSAARKMEMLFCREFPMNKREFSITTRWKIVNGMASSGVATQE